MGRLDMEETMGMKLVGANFNPSGNKSVDIIKLLMAEAIDELLKGTPSSMIPQEIQKEAILKIIDAQMWAVKSIIETSKE